MNMLHQTKPQNAVYLLNKLKTERMEIVPDFILKIVKYSCFVQCMEYSH